jgi:hypothetical protein
MRQSAQVVGEMADQAQVLKGLIERMKNESGAEALEQSAGPGLASRPQGSPMSDGAAAAPSAQMRLPPGFRTPVGAVSREPAENGVALGTAAG